MAEHRRVPAGVTVASLLSRRAVSARAVVVGGARNKPHDGLRQPKEVMAAEVNVLEVRTDLGVKTKPLDADVIPQEEGG